VVPPRGPAARVLKRSGDSPPESLNPSRDGVPTQVVVILLVAIVAVGAWLRFSGLANQSLWNDELWTWQIADHPTLSDLLTKSQLPRDVHPPLYFIFMHYWQKHLGDSETVLRIPSAAAGVLVVLAMYLLGRRLYSEREGLIAAALTAVLWCPVFFSQEARAYAMLLLFSILTGYFWSSVVGSLCAKERPGTWSVIGYVATAVVTCYLHYYGLYLVALEGLAAFGWLLLRREWRRAAIYVPLLYVPVVLAYLPWLPTMMKQLSVGSTLRPPGLHTPWRFLEFLFNQSGAVAGAALVLYAWLLTCAVRDRRKKKATPSRGSAMPSAGLLLALWLVVPFVGVFASSLLLKPVFNNRNLIISLPAAYLLVARGIARIPVRGRQHAAITLVVCFLLVLHLVFGLRHYSTPHNDQFREAVAYVVEHDRSLQSSLIVGHSYGRKFFDYYFVKLGSNRRIDIRGGYKETIPGVVRAVRTRNPQYVWILYGNMMPDMQFIQFMKQNFTFVHGREYRFAGALLFENKPPPARR